MKSNLKRMDVHGIKGSTKVPRFFEISKLVELKATMDHAASNRKGEKKKLIEVCHKKPYNL